MLFLILSLTSLVISLLTTALIKQRLSQQFLDLPNDRSSHTQPTPRGGGLGFLVGFALTSLLAAGFGIIPGYDLSMWLVLIPLAVIGILDDRQGVPASARYLVQLGAAVIAIAYFGHFPIPWLDNFSIVGKIVAIALSIIGMTALINFYNFMDGLDGLVGGCVAVQLSFLAFYSNQPIFWLLVAAIGGFLYWNWSPAKIFMGDVGSTVLGATVAIAALNQSSAPSVAWSALAITLPLAIDAIYTLCRRLLRRENIFKAHRSHLYQRLQQTGLSHDKVALLYISFNGVIAACIAYFGEIGAFASLICTMFALVCGEIYLQSLQRQLAKNN
ncbi:MAG: glycosyltransferase family 4 protein [Hydrococcus sp. Prado102]|jgi:UDP-N-acetylmuramyl pentapeptide phosphotransferase/UDP-N-acetylglucosamine-1-phosphate transferase|nr:glycosyltransferase family 4 protein [Hydrococcus sp. Prado102]